RAAGVSVRILSRAKILHVLFAPCDWPDDEKLTAFEAMLGGACHHLEQRRWVVLEGMPFSRRREVDALRVIAPEFGAVPVIVECAVSPELAVARISDDALHAPDHQGREDGTASVDIVSSRREPLDPDITIDMTQSPQAVADDLFARLQALARHAG
ncbi:MAG: hypothetical protein ACKOYM_00815, partial [Actinomycetes bacterium]